LLFADGNSGFIKDIYNNKCKWHYGKIIRKNMYYIDKTRFIHELEKLPNYLFLIRPRRFGKIFMDQFVSILL